MHERPDRPLEDLLREQSAEGYAWALLDDVAERSLWAQPIVATLLKAETWMAQDEMRTVLDVPPNAFAQTRSMLNHHRDGLIDFRQKEGIGVLRLNPRSFVRQRESALGASLTPAIARTISLCRRRFKGTSLHPVLDRIETVFRQMDASLHGRVPEAHQSTFRS